MRFFSVSNYNSTDQVRIFKSVEKKNEIIVNDDTF